MIKHTSELRTVSKFKTVGVIGGLGPETGFNFCLNVNNKFRGLTGCQPDIVLENLPVSKSAEESIINGYIKEEHKELLMSSVKRLNKSSVDFIAIPCNTVHVFIEELRRVSEVPIISIIEETAKDCNKKGFKKIGVIASETTISQKLHENELKKLGIEAILPDAIEQKSINNIIIKIIHNKENNEDKNKILKIIKKIKSSGADAIILGCTELPFLISQKDSELPLIDTLNILEKATVNFLVGVD